MTRKTKMILQRLVILNRINKNNNTSSIIPTSLSLFGVQKRQINTNKSLLLTIHDIQQQRFRQQFTNNLVLDSIHYENKYNRLNSTLATTVNTTTSNTTTTSTDVESVITTTPPPPPTRAPVIKSQQFSLPMGVPTTSSSSTTNPSSMEQNKTFNVLDRPTSPNHAQRYQIGRAIGSGNYALVKEAFDRKTGEYVAIKIMNKRKCGAAICKNEVDVLLSLSRKVRHQRVTPVLDVFEDTENLYIVLELLRGGELYERVAERGRLPEIEVAQILRKLVYALEALHRHGILHRDIKLENIVMRDRTNDFKIADFGFALESKSSNNNNNMPVSTTTTTNTTGGGLTRSASFYLPSTNTSATTTTTGTSSSPSTITPLSNIKTTNTTGNNNNNNKLAGTLGYAAPEVLKEALYGPSCDVWSAGIVTFILLAGYPPFPLLNPDAVANASQENKIKAEIEAIEFGRSPENWRKTMNEHPWTEISVEAKNLVTKMLILDPQRRITTRGILQDPFIRRYSETELHEFTDFE
jgi:serine/threonine protein kinase